MGDPNPKPNLSAQTPFKEWMRSECVIDHSGEEVSYTLTVASDGRSFTLVFRDGSERTVPVEGEHEIDFVFPSVEGTVVLCQMTDGRERFYDVRDGHRFKEEELRSINPRFYT